MNESRNLEVETWSPETAITRGADKTRRFWPSGVLGLLGTLSFHACVLPSVIVGIRSDRTNPPEALEPAVIAAVPLVLIDMPESRNRVVDIATVFSSAVLPAKTLNVKMDPDPPALLNVDDSIAEKDTLATADGGSRADLARLAGIYSGQIHARIERQWRRPRTPVNEASGRPGQLVVDDTFRCHVQIEQDLTGKVVEVLVPNCQGSPAWQRSLVAAIQQASPLPAPPSPTVFAHSIALDFVGFPFGSSQSDDDYEAAQFGMPQSEVSAN